MVKGANDGLLPVSNSGDSVEDDTKPKSELGLKPDTQAQAGPQPVAITGPMIDGVQAAKPPVNSVEPTTTPSDPTTEAKAAEADQQDEAGSADEPSTGGKLAGLAVGAGLAAAAGAALYGVANASGSQSEVAFTESFDYWNENVVSGATLYMALVTSSLFPVGNGAITSSSILSSLTECSGTGYARAPFTLGTSSSGIMAIPQVVFSNGSNAWSNNCAAVALCSASTGGVALYCWDLSAVRDMSITGSTLTVNTLDIFLENPGGI